MYKLACNYCGKEVEREKNVSYACCFSCKIKRQKEVAKKFAKNKKLNLCSKLPA